MDAPYRQHLFVPQGAMPPLQIGYPVMDRLGVVAAGFLAAGLVMAIGSFMRHHLGESRAGHRRTAARLR